MAFAVVLSRADRREISSETALENLTYLIRRACLSPNVITRTSPRQTRNIPVDIRAVADSRMSCHGRDTGKSQLTRKSATSPCHIHDRLSIRDI